MDYSEFKTEMEKKVRELAPEKTVNVFPVTKNNGVVMDAVTVKAENQNMAPMFYLQDFYIDYTKGASIDELSKELLKANEQLTPGEGMIPDIDPSDIRFEDVKDSLRCRILNTKLNRKSLAECPHITIMDLSVVYYFNFPEIPLRNGGIRVSSELFEDWNVPLHSLDDIARENTFASDPPVIVPTTDGIEDRFLPPFPELSFEETVRRAEAAGPLPMYFLSTRSGSCGATSIIAEKTKDYLSRLSRRYESNLILIPCSVHEFMVVPDNGDISLKALTEMIDNINSTMLYPTEILSDHPYLYSWTMAQVLSLPG